MGTDEQNDYFIRNAAVAYALDIARLNCGGASDTILADAEKIRKFLSGEEQEG